MLKNIPSILSPELLKILMEMGHGDYIVIGDGNFPAATNAQRLVRLDGHGVPEILDAILKLMPLDTYVDAPVSLMDNGDPDNRPEIWATYKEIVEKTRVTKTSVLSSVLTSTIRQRTLLQSLQRARLQFTLILFSKRVL